MCSLLADCYHCVSPMLVINGEKATLETPTFAQKRQRTLDMLIRSLYQDLMPDLHKVCPLIQDLCSVPVIPPFPSLLIVLLGNGLLLLGFQNMLNRRSFSDVLPESPKSARKKEEARQAEFVRIGQVSTGGIGRIWTDLHYCVL